MPTATAKAIRATTATTVATTAQVFTPASSDSSRVRAAVGIKHDMSYTRVNIGLGDAVR